MLKYLFPNITKSIIKRPKYQYLDLKKRANEDSKRSPEKYLLSSAVSFEGDQGNNIVDIKGVSEETSLKINDKKGSYPNFKVKGKTDEFSLSKSDYTVFMENNPKGRVCSFEYKNCFFTLVGAQYEFLPAKNIYKLLRYSNPEIVFLQVRPDQVLTKFKTTILNKNTNLFSNRLYTAQCLREAPELMPSSAHCKDLVKELKENNLFIEEGSGLREGKETHKNFKPLEKFERLTLSSLAATSFYCEKNDLKIFLGDLPEVVFRENIANSLTLMQLQNLFTHTSRELALYPDIQPQTPLNMAFYLYPEIFLQPSDKYMSTCLEYLLKRYKRITALVGYTQCDSILSFFENRKVSSLEKELEIIPIKNNLVFDLTPEEIIEKHALLDVMFYGKDIMEKIESYDFETSYNMIKKYGDQFHTDSMNFGKMRLLHYEALQKYAKFSKTNFDEGKLMLKREFLRKKASQGY